MKFLKWLFGLFSPYVDPFERKVDKFFRNVKSTSAGFEVKKGLLALMQENLIVTNVWMERKYKGYRYLDKATRRKMYQDVKAMVAVFEQEPAVSEAGLTEMMGEQPLPAYKEKLLYLARIMNFLRPGKHYHYIQTASFGKLLRDPAKEKLEGDCNQIVTLYIYLYSLKYDLADLEIKLLPEHVCLHFKGIDIEATNATFAHYKEESEVLPVTEIISTNLLDLADFREDLQSISPRVVVKSSQLAYAISSLKPLVAKNLNIAYLNLALAALKGNDFQTAIFYYSKSDDKQALQNAYQRAAVYYMDAGNFSKATYFAQQSGNNDLNKAVRHNEGIHYYKSGQIEKALAIFRSLGDNEMVKACYAKQYNELAQKVSSVRTIDDVKRYKSTFQKMLSLAQQMGDEKLASSVRKTLSQV